MTPTAAPTPPAPPVTPDTEGWWNATRERRLTVQTCSNCGNVQYYPRALCVACGNGGIELTDVRGNGRVYSFTIVHRSPDPDSFPAPYVVALVRLDEGPLLLSNIVGPDSLSTQCDAPVTIAWKALPDGRHLPLFKLKARES